MFFHRCLLEGCPLGASNEGHMEKHDENPLKGWNSWLSVLFHNPLWLCPLHPAKQCDLIEPVPSNTSLLNTNKVLNFGLHGCNWPGNQRQTSEGKRRVYRPHHRLPFRFLFHLLVPMFYSSFPLFSHRKSAQNIRWKSGQNSGKDSFIGDVDSKGHSGLQWRKAKWL